MKVLVEQYVTYGKGDGLELAERYVIEDTKENRENIIDELNEDDIEGAESFIKGESNKVNYYICDDWDSPTGGYIFITTKEDKLKEIHEKYEKDVKEIKDLFDEATSNE